MATEYPKPADVKHDWWVVDLDGKTVGRAASQIASLLRGKHKPSFTPHVDTGDFVVVVNAERVRVTGRKADVLEYDTYSRYPGGRRLYSFQRMQQIAPERIVQLAVKRMLPKNKLGRHMLTKLKIYKGKEHPHSAQQPKELKLSV